MLYGIENDSNTLITIDPVTGLGTSTGVTVTGIDNSPDMAFAADGTLYVWNDPSADDLYTVDLMTGVATLVGESGISTAALGLDINSAGTIFAKSGTAVYTIDPTTGAATFLVSITGADPGNALAFDAADTLYTLERAGGDSLIYTIDLTTGVATLVGATGVSNLAALAFLLSVIMNLDQQYVGPIIQQVLANNTRGLVGSLDDRLTAAFMSSGNATSSTYGDADVLGDPYAGHRFGMWARGSVGEANADASVDNLPIPDSASYDSDHRFVQGGPAATLWSGNNHRIVGSVFGHYAESDTSVSDGAGVLQGSFDTESAGIGGSLTFLATSGLYADLIGLASWHDINTTTAGGATGSTNGETLAGSLEVGLRRHLVDWLSIVPQGQVVYLNTHIDGFTDSSGATFAFSDADAVESRIGMAFESEWGALETGMVRANASINVTHDFTNESNAVVNGTLLGFDAEGTELLFAGGVAVAPAHAWVKFGLKGDYSLPISDDGREAYNLSAVAKFTLPVGH